jgi:hypothetical protein
MGVRGHRHAPTSYHRGNELEAIVEETEWGSEPDWTVMEKKKRFAPTGV